MSNEQRLRDLIADHLAVQPAQVKVDAKIVEDLGADSLDQIEILMAVEEDFDIDIDDEAWFEASTFGAILKIVDDLTAPNVH